MSLVARRKGGGCGSSVDWKRDMFFSIASQHAPMSVWSTVSDAGSVSMYGKLSNIYYGAIMHGTPI